MRTFLSGLSVLLCGFLLMGSVGLSAPILPSKSFYINDHAVVIGQENRDSMLETAQELYEKTGVRAVLLTIENLDGRTPDEYAEVIFNSWEIGAGGVGILILLSTEEKCIVTKSNADISATYSMAAADKLAGAEQFDAAASNYFFAVIDSLYNKYPSGEDAEPVSPELEGVRSEASVASEQKSQSTPKTQDAETTSSTQGTQSTENTETSSTRSTVFYSISFLFFIFIIMRALRVSFKYRKKYNKNDTYYRRSSYLSSSRREVRQDDGDYPSGFGGLGNRKAIYSEDVDTSEDIGIIKRKGDDISSGEE